MSRPPDPPVPDSGALHSGRRVTLAGDTWGRPDAPHVLLLTGAGQTRQAWGRTGAMLASAGFRAVAVDHRGHGDSDWPAGDAYGIEVFLEDAVALCRNLDRPVIVGASLGSMAALMGIDAGLIDARGLVTVDVAPGLELSGGHCRTL